MGTDLQIERTAELCDALSCLPEKFVVDFANGIDVSRDHVRVQRTRTGFFARMYDDFTGKGSRRQIEINASLTDGVEGALVWLTDLTDSLAKSNYALAKVNERVATIYGAVSTLTNYSVDTRKQLADLSRSLNLRVDQLAVEVARVAFEQRAERHLEHVFNRWAAGRFESFSFAGRFYSALEELRWGAFGDFCRCSTGTDIRKEFLDDLTNRAIRQLTTDKGALEKSRRQPVEEWTRFPSGRGFLPHASEALAYLGDWSDPELHPFVFTISQSPRILPVATPKLWSTERLAEALVSEVFERE